MTRGIYCFTNKISGKQYIGQSMNIEKRYREHKTKPWTKSCKDKNTAFYKALIKYGFHNFDFFVLDENDNYSKEDLNKLEIFYISKFDTYFNGYNLTPGGDSYYVPHKLSKEEVLSIKNKIKNSKESFVSIAKEFNVQDSLISQINQGKIWGGIGENIFPLREDTFFRNKGESNNNATLTNKEVIEMRQRYVNETLPEIYEDYKDKVSFSTVKKVLYGVQFKSLPIYKKRQQTWVLNGTCIDYPRLEE